MSRRAYFICYIVRLFTKASFFPIYNAVLLCKRLQQLPFTKYIDLTVYI